MDSVWDLFLVHYREERDSRASLSVAFCLEPCCSRYDPVRRIHCQFILVAVLLILRYRNTFFTGTILIVVTIQTPQRFQSVNGDSAFTAGVRLLPFSIMNPIGAIIATILVGRTRIPPIYFLFAGGLLTVAGTAGLSVIPNTPKIWNPQYGFQIIAGAGLGCFNGMLTLLIPFVFEKKDLGKYS